MIFDKTKIITCLDDNLEKWIGWSGYFAQTLVHLRDLVQGENNIPETFKAVITDINTMNRIGGCIFFSAESRKYYNFFYPVDPPKEKKEEKKNCENCRYSENTFGNTAVNKHLICTYDGENGATEPFWTCKDFSLAKQQLKYLPCKDIEELLHSAYAGEFKSLKYDGNDKKFKKYALYCALRGKVVWFKRVDIIETIQIVPLSSRPNEPTLVYFSPWLKRFVDLEEMFENCEWADKEGDERIIGVRE